MKPIIKSQEKYDNIVNILKVEYTIVYSSKHTKYYLKRKAELFILFENLPLLKDTENGHKRVFMEETVLSMKIEVKKLHNQNRYAKIVFTICTNNVTFQFLDVLLERFVIGVIPAYKLNPLRKGKV